MKDHGKGPVFSSGRGFQASFGPLNMFHVDNRKLLYISYQILGCVIAKTDYILSYNSILKILGVQFEVHL